MLNNSIAYILSVPWYLQSFNEGWEVVYIRMDLTVTEVPVNSGCYHFRDIALARHIIDTHNKYIGWVREDTEPNRVKKSLTDVFKESNDFSGLNKTVENFDKALDAQEKLEVMDEDL
jgi:hypothetical protein